MKKVILILLLAIPLFSTAQRTRGTATFDADTTTRPAAGFYGIGIRSNIPFLVKNTGNTLRFGMVNSFTTNYLPKFNSSGGFSNSQFFDNGTNVGIGTTSPAFPFVIERPSSHTMALLTPNIGTSGTFTGITFGYTGTTYQKGGIYYESQDANGRGKMHFALNGASSSANTSISDSKMMIDYSGNVGIGTTNPSGLLHLKNSSGNQQFFIDDNTGRSSIQQSDGLYINAGNNLPSSSNASNIIFRQSSSLTELARFTKDGKFGLGTNAPTQKLDVSGVIKSNAGIETTFSSPGLSFGASKFMFQQEGASNTRAYFTGANASTFGSLEFYRATSTGSPEIVLSLVSSGNVGVGTTTPTAKLEVAGDIHTGYTDGRFIGNYYSGSYRNGLLFNANNRSTGIVSKSGDASDFIWFGTNAETERVRITNVGNVGIGTTSPSRLLEVNGESRMQSLNITASGANSWTLGVSTSRYYLYNATTATDAFSILNNGSVGIGIVSPDPSAKLHISSTTQGVLITRGTTTQINAIASPANGLMVYNTTLNKLCVYESGTWKQVTTTNM